MRANVSNEQRENRMLYRLTRDSALTPAQLRYVRGTNALIDGLVDRGWIARQDERIALTERGRIGFTARPNKTTCG